MTSPYEFWKTQKEKTHNLYLKAAHKALDIPEDDMNINVKKGISTAAFLGAMFLTGGLATGIPLLMNFLQQPTVSQQKPIDSEYEVRHYNMDGELIKIPQKKD